MTFKEYEMIEHIEDDSYFTETTSERVRKLPNGDKRTDFSMSGEEPYGVGKLKEAMKQNPWFGGDHHCHDAIDARRKASVINRYVKANDHFIIMGDMEDHDDPDIDVVRLFVKEIKCKNKYLIIGNNDSLPLEEYQKMGIICVTDIFQYGKTTLSHFPLEMKDGEICIHAHLHGSCNEDQKGADAYWYCDGSKCYDVWDKDFIPKRYQSILDEFYHLQLESVEVIEETVNKYYYRVAYEGEGIYEAVRRRVGVTEWKKILNDPNIRWLPKPPTYFSGYMSYFTEKGYLLFQKTSLPILSKYLDPKKIEINKINSNIGYVMYQDEYQIILTDDRGIHLLNIAKFNEKLNWFKYQIKNKEYQLDKIRNEKDYDRCYRMLSPEEFIKYGGGVCWDYVIYQADYFKKFFPTVEIHTFYHQTVHVDPGDAPTHTFTLFREDKLWYWFESSWKEMMGIWTFSSLDHAISFIRDLLITHAKNEPGISPLKDDFVVEYIPNNPKYYGMTCKQFMDEMVALPESKYNYQKNNKPYWRHLNKEQYRMINGNTPIMMESVIIESGSNIAIDGPVSKNVKLYHGSPIQGLKEIKPFAEHKPDFFTKEERVSASSEQAFAACYGARWHDGIAHQGTFDGVLYFAPTNKVDMDSPCSLYEIKNDGSFTMRGHHECYTTYPMKVIGEKKFDSFREMLEAYNVNIISYEEYEKRRKASVTQYINESGSYEKKDIREEVMEESVIFSKKNIELNMDLWSSNKNKVLYITGLSGSGKTTYAKHYACKKVEVIEFDALTSVLVKGLDKMSHKELIHPSIMDYLKENDFPRVVWEDKEKLSTHCKAYVEYLENYAKERDMKYVLEGVQIYAFIPAEYYEDKPLIIIGTSLLRSSKQRASRSMKKEHGLHDKLIVFINEIKMFPMFYKNEKLKQKFEDVFKEEVMTESVIFKRDNLYFNTKKLSPIGENPIVFITGFPGAGKSTTLTQIQERYHNVEGISLDFLTVPLVKKKRANDWIQWLDKVNTSPLIKEYLSINYERVKLLNDDFNDPRLVPVYLDFFEFVKKEMMGRKHIAVIEGTQIFAVFEKNIDYFDDKPLIVIGTSVLTAYFRKWKRDVFLDKDFDWPHIKMQLQMIPVYKGYNKILEMMYKKYKDDNEGQNPFLEYMNK